MDYKNLVTEEGTRESLIAISYSVPDEIHKNTNGITKDSITSTRNKTIDELRSELISISTYQPSSDYNTKEVKARKV